MLDLRIIAGGQALPLFDLPALLGRRQAAKEVGDQIEALIAFMDEMAGDPDLEDSEACEGEIDATGRSLTCRTLADETENDSADNGDRAWQEWDARNAKARRHAMHEPVGLATTEEDDEDDDPAGGDVVDEPHDAEEDHGAEEAGEEGTWPEGEDAYGALRTYGDGQEDDGIHVRNIYRDRIRRRRCIPAPMNALGHAFEFNGPTPPCPIGIGA